MIQFLVTNREHIDQLKPKLREADRIEMLALGFDPEVALEYSVLVSDGACWSVMDDENVLGILGVSTHPEDPSVGVIWMLSSDEAFSSPRRFLQHNKPIIEGLSKGYRLLTNFIHKDNLKAIKWLKWCGFTFDMGGVTQSAPKDFILFYKEF